MIFDTVKPEIYFRVNVKNLSQIRVTTGLGFLKYKNEYLIHINNKVHKIEILEQSKLEEIGYFLNTCGYKAIINVIEAIRDELFTMEIYMFSFPIIEIYEPFNISIDDKILKTLKDTGFARNIEEAKKVLKKKISFIINDQEYFLSSTGNSSMDEIYDFEREKKQKETDLKKQINYLENNDEPNKDTRLEELNKQIKDLTSEETIKSYKDEKENLAFCIYGESLKVPIRRDEKEDEKSKLIITRIISSNKNISKGSLILTKAKITFTDNLMETKIAKDFEDILEDENGYLNTWDKYIEKEGELLLKKARDVGELEVSTINHEGGFAKVKVKNLRKDTLQDNDTICFTSNIPSYVTKETSFLDHFNSLSDTNLNIKNDDEYFTIDKISHETIYIKTSKNISHLKDRKIVLSLYGNETQIKRKLEARNRLIKGASANPLLGFIIEDTDKIKNLRTTNIVDIIEPLSIYVKKKIFPENDPTPNQEEAIGIALNTPDIAIIQGPPGTGKTTVLTAIIERLNEEADKTKDIRGEILVAGFQHDAVENIISRLEINGIPTPKYGKKSNTIVDMTSFEKIIEWGKEICNNIEDKTELRNQQKINSLNKYYEVYIINPSKQYAVLLVEYILNELSKFIDNTLKQKSIDILNKLNEKNVENSDDLKYIYALRTNKSSFLDDGPYRNLDLLVSNIGIMLSEEEISILRDTSNKNLDEYLKKLSKLKYELLNRVYPKKTFKVEKANEEIIALVEEVIEKLSKGDSYKDKKKTILSSYLNEIENNPFALKSMIEEYSFVFSSTTGQSMGKEIARAKKLDKGNYGTFDTLIIDEAARVAPMDLLIALVQARRRIILVGDHRQLPHMVEDNIVNQLELTEEHYIKESMFGYLKQRAKRLTEFDGIKRETTLNNQYRTHPVLGQFVSKNFYKKHEEEFNSPLPEDFFYQNLEGIENTPAIWLDVKHDTFDKKPRSRVCEAKEIMKKLRLWINSENGTKLDFGIITFYRDQVNTIENELENEFTKEEIESFWDRLKIGTVDSFQGMEFDIVFLSVVKSMDINRISDSLKGYQLFGFITSKSRLCVSMSRQKKSLIIVGDKEFYEHKRAKQDVPELYKFLQLCKNEGKVL